MLSLNASAQYGQCLQCYCYTLTVTKATCQGNIKKLFQYLKNSRTDQLRIPPLKQNGNLHTENKEKTNILNQQFQSVFTPFEALSLQELSLMKYKSLWMTRS